MTFNGVMALYCIISPNLVASGVHCVKVVEDVIVKKYTITISSPDEFLVLKNRVNTAILHFASYITLTF